MKFLLLSKMQVILKDPKTLPNCVLIMDKILVTLKSYYTAAGGAQWLSGRVLDSRPKGRGFEPHRRHSVVVLEQDTFILA